jgi:diguanylate cyclase (GGDEF)-like protein/PAS domain S-box-containing protein
MRADLPANEDARLQALHDYCVLDTMPEQSFDDLTALAAQICGTPISLVSLIDSERQWFKSKKGLDLDEVAREFAFCAHALHRPDELFIVHDASQDPRFADNPFVTGETHIRFYTGAPLVTAAGETLGTLCVIDQQPRQLSPAQLQALQILARQTMALLEWRRQTIRFVDEIALRVQTEVALRESDARFQAFMDHGPVVAFIKNDQGRYTYANQPFLQRFGFSMNQVLGQSDFDLWPDAAERIRAIDQSLLSGELGGEQEAIRVDTEAAPQPDGSTQFWQVYKFVLRQGGGQRRLVAGMAIDITTAKSYEMQLERSQKRLETTLKKVQAQSLQDGLTGIHNRRAFDEKIAGEFDRSRRYDVPLSILMIDVDRFKAFNDSFGHLEGDEVLKTMGRLLTEKARTCDFVARYGGEEFVIILPSTAQSGASMAAERFRQAVLSMPWTQRQVSISVGVATLTHTMSTAKDLVSAADQALYSAKQKGRNCVVQAG